MSDLERRLAGEILAIRAIDCHSHVPHQAPHARSLADLLGYHYYTELAHSAGMPADAVDPRRSEADRDQLALFADERIDDEQLDQFLEWFSSLLQEYVAGDDARRGASAPAYGASFATHRLRDPDDGRT